MPSLTKVDRKRELKPLYTPPAREPVIVEVPDLSFLMADGHGSPESAQFQQAVEALYSVSYGLKFMLKLGLSAVDFTVMPLEGLWWAEDLSVFATGEMSSWDWTAMINQPELVTVEHVEEAKLAAAAKRELPALDKLRLERYVEGTAAQMMHVGPFSTEPATIERLHAFIAAQGCRPAGRHHEIYLSDPHRTAPEKLRTILRQPVLPV